MTLKIHSSPVPLPFADLPTQPGSEQAWGHSTEQGSSRVVIAQSGDRFTVVSTAFLDPKTGTLNGSTRYQVLRGREIVLTINQGGGGDETMEFDTPEGSFVRWVNVDGTIEYTRRGEQVKPTELFTALKDGVGDYDAVGMSKLTEDLRAKDASAPRVPSVPMAGLPAAAATQLPSAHGAKPQPLSADIPAKQTIITDGKCAVIAEPSSGKAPAIYCEKQMVKIAKPLGAEHAFKADAHYSAALNGGAASAAHEFLSREGSRDQKLANVLPPAEMERLKAALAKGGEIQVQHVSDGAHHPLLKHVASSKPAAQR